MLPHFDVIALQEVFELGSTRQSRLIAAAKKLGFHYITRSRPPKLYALCSTFPFLCEYLHLYFSLQRWSIKWVDGGVLILSKYPIVESDAHIFRNGSYPLHSPLPSYSLPLLKWVFVFTYSFFCRSGNQIDNQAAKQVLHAKIQVTESSQSLYQRVNRVEGQLRHFIEEKTSAITSEQRSNNAATRREDVPPTEEQFVHVFTTHLQASYNENDGAVNSINDNARLAQVIFTSVFDLQCVVLVL